MIPKLDIELNPPKSSDVEIPPEAGRIAFMHITDVDALSCSEVMLKIDQARVDAPFSLLESM